MNVSHEKTKASMKFLKSQNSQNSNANVKYNIKEVLFNIRRFPIHPAECLDIGTEVDFVL
jgi:hypothetical protein